MSEKTTSDQLESLPLFQGLDRESLERILQAARPRKVEEGGYFFFQGDSADRVYTLLRGRVRLLQSNPGDEPILLNVLAAPATFGVMSMTGADTYPVTAQAIVECRAIYWAQPEMGVFLSRYPQWERNAMHIMAGHVQEYQERYRQLATERVERRLARTLIRLASQVGVKTNEGILINLPLTRQDLAEMTGTTLYTVSRTLSQWEADGLVVAGREKVVIRSTHGLVSIAEDFHPAENDQ